MSDPTKCGGEVKFTLPIALDPSEIGFGLNLILTGQWDAAYTKTDLTANCEGHMSDGSCYGVCALARIKAFLEGSEIPFVLEGQCLQSPAERA